MKKTRRIGAIVAMATAAVGMASAVTTAPASAVMRGPQPVSSWLRAVRANTDSWVDIYWRTDRPICDVEVRVDGRWVEVGYPGHRRYATFDRGDSLRPGRVDRTTIQVNPTFSRAGVANLWATISYDNCFRNAPTRRQTFSLSLPVLRNDDWPGHGGPGNGGPGNGWPGNGGPGNGWPGNGGPGNGGPGNGGPGHGGPGNGGPGPQTSPSPSASPSPSPSASPSPSGSPSSPGGQGDHGQGGHSQGGQGQGGQGQGGQGQGGQGQGGQGHHGPGSDS